jgi:hypothetical protein
MRSIVRGFVVAVFVVASFAFVPGVANSTAGAGTTAVGGCVTPGSVGLEIDRQISWQSPYVAQASACHIKNGHYHIWGPGLDVNSPDREWNWFDATQWYGGNGFGTVCAQAWDWNGASWTSLGFTCKPS